MPYIQRSIPFGQILKLIFGKFTIVFGLFFSMLSFVFLGSFLPSINLSYISDDAPSVMGHITRIVPTETYINENQVKEFYFRYLLPDGSKHTGISYSEFQHLQEGDEVNVLYKPQKADIARIEGMRSSAVPAWILLPFSPFLIIGLSFLFYGVRKSHNEIRLLRRGYVVKAEVLAKEPTHRRINRNPVFRFRFRFKADGGRIHETSLYSQVPYWFDDHELDFLLYDPDNPKNAIMVASLPDKIKHIIYAER